MRTSTSPRATLVTACCPPFAPATWNKREVSWHERQFVREHVHSFMRIPLDFGDKLTRVRARILAAGAAPPHGLVLADEISPWRSELYLEVTRPVPGAEMATLSGDFLTKVYDGPYRESAGWVADMHRYVASQARRLRRLYFAYPTCPGCADAYGHNYVVLFARVDHPPS